MHSFLQSARSVLFADPMERTLGRYYPRFVEWSAILTRGDNAVAEEIVQDLCLHLTVTQPDLSGIEDLDAYFYICLRNMYLSHLSRVSRERLRVVQVEDYDAVALAIVSGDRDNVDVQNELLRICHFVIRRKQASKSASHFILHFFWGYDRADVARIARLPISAIYNKLKDIRDELRDDRQTNGTGSIHLLSQIVSAEDETLRVALPTEDFLAKVRVLLLDAKAIDCMPEDELLGPYKTANAAPVPNKQLAHLAGCESCLRVLDRALRLEDRDGPLDDCRSELDMKRGDRRSFHETLQAVHRKRKQLLQERPVLLAIAVDGRVVAYHDIDSPHSSLSTRFEPIHPVRFVEVFNERGSRLASLVVDQHVIAPSLRNLSQKTLFSDNRWLQLDIRFDGLGMHAEATYVDPAIAPGMAQEPLASSMRAEFSFRERLTSVFGARLIPVVTASMIALMIAVGITMYRYIHPPTRDILVRATQIEEHVTPTEALYQVVRLELPSERGESSLLGSVEVWRGFDDRTVRQLYSTQHTLLATSITQKEDAPVESRAPHVTLSSQEQQIVDSGVWKTDLSVTDFASAASVRSSNGFELTKFEEGRNGVLSRTLLLDRGYRVLVEIVRLRTAHGSSEVRMVQTVLRRVPNREMPDEKVLQKQSPSSLSRDKKWGDKYTALQASSLIDNLQVAILFELYRLRVDTASPIDMKVIEGDHIRLSGTVPSKQLLTAIRDRVFMLRDSDRVDFGIRLASDAASTKRLGTTPVQELQGNDREAPAAAFVQRAVRSRGMTSSQLKDAEEQFTVGVLSHAQAALQHAYALERLGNLAHKAQPGALELRSRSEWTAMVEHHSITMSTELQALTLQLNSLPYDAIKPMAQDLQPIEDVEDFYRTASLIRERMQRVNVQVMELFASGSVHLTEAGVPMAILQLREDLPAMDVERATRFAANIEEHRPASTIASKASPLP